MEDDVLRQNEVVSLTFDTTSYLYCYTTKMLKHLLHPFSSVFVHLFRF